MPVIVWGIDPDVVNRVPSNDGVNHIRYSLNPEKKLVTNYVVVGYLLKVVALGFGVDFLRSIRALERRYGTEANIELSDGALYDRFTPELVEFLRECVLHAIEFQAQQQSRALGEKLNGFKDIIIQDSTIIRLHESLADMWPATRSKRVAAGVKVSCVVSAVADGVKSVKLFSERTSEIKTLSIGSWVKGRILLIDPRVL